MDVDVHIQPPLYPPPPTPAVVQHPSTAFSTVCALPWGPAECPWAYSRHTNPSHLVWPRWASSVLWLLCLSWPEVALGGVLWPTGGAAQHSCSWYPSLSQVRKNGVLHVATLHTVYTLTVTHVSYMYSVYCSNLCTLSKQTVAVVFH